MKKLTKGLCLSTAIVAAGAMLSSTAMAAEIFQVDEGTVVGTAANIVTADKINGTYLENVLFTSATDFAVSIGINFNSYTLNGQPLPIGSNPSLVETGSAFAGPGYSLYATFVGVGTWAGVDPTNFTFTSGTYSLYVDPNADTVLTAAGALTPFSAAITTDDYMIAQGTVLAGTGTLDCGPNQGINCGSFGTNLDVMLTDPAGLAFFSDPDPFFQLAFTSGDFQEFDVGPQFGVQTVNGNISLSFEKIPEPATLALFGLGLAGMAGVARRKSKKQA